MATGKRPLRDPVPFWPKGMSGPSEPISADIATLVDQLTGLMGGAE
jgi:hypothetical protein